jgi:hypothetical protein
LLLHDPPDPQRSASALPVFKLLVVHGVRDYGDRTDTRFTCIM